MQEKMQYYNEIKSKLIENEAYEKVKDYSKERHRVITYYEIGRLLKDAGGKYGDKIIEEYAKKLVVEVGKKYDTKTLYKMRQLYNVFKDENVAPVVRNLSWSQCLLLLPLKNVNAINYYIEQVKQRSLSKRQLETIIKNKEYERLPEDTRNKLVNKEEPNVVDFVKNPIVIRNNSNYYMISEKILQRLILENIPTFLKELGEGFTFIENEYKIKLGDRYNYIDLLLYNKI